MKRCPRIILNLCAFMVAGAIVNVAVAWGCAIRGPTNDYANNTAKLAEVNDGFHRWFSNVSHQSGPTFHRVVADYARDDGIHFPESLKATMPDDIPRWAHRVILDGVGSSPSNFHSCGIEAVGLPCLAMYSVFMGDGLTGGVRRTMTFTPNVDKARIGILLESPGSKAGPFAAKVLPVLPLWPGFAINTVFYTAILWLLFAAPGLVRRRIRARRGQCPACAYPVGSSDVCTECGRPEVCPEGASECSHG